MLFGVKNKRAASQLRASFDSISGILLLYSLIIYRNTTDPTRSAGCVTYISNA